MAEHKASHGQILRFIWKYAARHRLVISFALLLKLASVGLHLAQPFFYKSAVDALSSSSPETAAFLVATQMVTLGMLVAITGITVMEGSTLIMSRIEAQMIQSAVQDVFAHVQRLSTKFHTNAFAGATARKIKRGGDGIEHIMDKLWFDIIPLCLFIVGLTSVLSVLEPEIGLIVFAGMLLYSAISITLNLVLFKRFRHVDKQDTKLMANLVDTLGGNALVKAFVSHDREDERHGNEVREWKDRALQSWYLATTFGWLQNISLLVLELVILMYALRLWLDGIFTTGTFVMMTFYVGLMWGYMRQIGNSIRDYLKAISNTEEMVALSALPLEIEDATDAKQLTVRGGAISVKNVHFHYDIYHEPLFDDLSLEVGPKETMALVGHSGSGKSTLIKLLMRLYDINGGAIEIDGQNIAKVTQASLRQATTLVPQDPILFHRSIGENIAYGNPGASVEDIRRAARYARAHDFIKELPNSYDTLVGERGVKLSGGERQRVAIARAILADKPILILDEATSSLDSVSEQYIQEALKHLLQNRTAIIIAHRLSTVLSCDRIAVLDRGKLVDCAPHKQLLQRCALYKEMVDLQSHGMLAE